MTDVLGMNVEILEKELIFTRLIHAPRELVFKAWTDPKMLAEWWGPKDFTNPVCEVDARPGGTYRTVMRSPGGDDFPVKGVYREVVEPEKLVMTDDMSDMAPEWIAHFNSGRGVPADAPLPNIYFTVIFEDDRGNTKLTIHTHFENNNDRDGIMKLGSAEGWAQSFEKLEALLATM